VDAVLIELLVLVLLVWLGWMLLHRIRSDQDAEIAEHWRRNGRDEPPRGW